MLKKNLIICMLIFTLLSLFNVSAKKKKFKKPKVQLSKDEVGSDYFESTYNYASIFCDKYTENNLNSIKVQARQYIIEDEKLTEEEKIDIIERLKKLKYEDDQYFFYQIISTQPFLKSELDFKIEIIDSENSNYIEDVIPCFFKVEQMYESALSGSIKQSKYYYYIWIIKSSVPLNEEYVASDSFPFEIVITFPNGEKRYYSYQ